MEIIIPIAPQAKPRISRSDKWKKRKCVEKYWEFKSELSKYAQYLPESFEVIFFIPMPNSWSEKKKKSFEGKPHQSRPDIDNLLKAIMDALASEDGFTHSVIAKKVWAREGKIYLNECKNHENSN